MLSSEFNHEAGALIRSLEAKVRQEPSLIHADFTPGIRADLTLDHIERALVSLIALYLQLKNPKTE